MKNKRELALSTLLIWLPTILYIYNNLNRKNNDIYITKISVNKKECNIV